MMAILRSRDNPRLRQWKRLVADPRARRRSGTAIIEGPHLVAACLDSGRMPKALIICESRADDVEISHLVRRAGVAPIVVADHLFAALADADSPQGIAAAIPLPHDELTLASVRDCVFLDAIQDAGNLGAILRSATAFGVAAAVLGPGCADAWSPKVLRAAMGAHFSLHLGSSPDLLASMESFGGRVICTVPRGGVPLEVADLSGRLGWIFGAEGRGVSADLAARATHKVSIPMSGATESLNVGAAAAICFYQLALTNRRMT